MRNPLLVSWLLSAALALPLSAATADPHQALAAPATGATPLGTQILDAAVTSPDPEGLGQGALDGRFAPFRSAGSHLLTGTQWFRLDPPPAGQAAVPRCWWSAPAWSRPWRSTAARAATACPWTITSVIPKFGGAEDKVFALPPGWTRQPLYARVTRVGRAVTDLQFSTSTLAQVLEGAAAHARIIALRLRRADGDGDLGAADPPGAARPDLPAVRGAVPAAGDLPGLLLRPGLLLAAPFLCCAPSPTTPTTCTVAVSAAVAALFVREFANLQLFSPRVYSAFGWLAVAFIGLALSNLLREFGLGRHIAAVGNLMFLGSAILTIVVAFLAWRRGGNRAAGWFLIAWSLLCTFQILTALRLLYTRADSAEGILYYGLAPSMVAAAVLIALGVSDHVRQQSLALTDAERRAQTDPLTGVLNRRSLIERLDAACLRARARNLPISVLFLDLDHFKLINDTFGHAAGDACLAGIIPPIQAELRQSDVIGRYGGEEFVVILERRGRRRRAPDRRAHLPARRRDPHRGLRRPDPAHLQHRGGRYRPARGLGTAPDRARRHRRVRGQALRAQPGAARRLARGLKVAMHDPRRRAQRHPAPAVAGAALLGVRGHRAALRRCASELLLQRLLRGARAG